MHSPTTDCGLPCFLSNRRNQVLLTAASQSIPKVVLWGGLISGSADLFAACTLAAIRGITPMRLLQTITYKCNDWTEGVWQRPRRCPIRARSAFSNCIHSCNHLYHCEPISYSAHRIFGVEWTSIWCSRSLFHDVYRLAKELSQTAILNDILSRAIGDSYVVRGFTNLTRC
jgi:hypothetical protein